MPLTVSVAERLALHLMKLNLSQILPCLEEQIETALKAEYRSETPREEQAYFPYPFANLCCLLLTARIVALQEVESWLEDLRIQHLGFRDQSDSNDTGKGPVEVAALREVGGWVLFEQ